MLGKPMDVRFNGPLIVLLVFLSFHQLCFAFSVQDPFTTTSSLLGYDSTNAVFHPSNAAHYDYDTPGNLLGCRTLCFSESPLHEKASFHDFFLGQGVKAATNLWPASSGGRQVINGIEYTTHALERMAPRGLIQKGTEVISRGVPPSAVENAIKFGTKSMGNTANEIVHTFENVRVITNPAGTRVISVITTGH